MHTTDVKGRWKEDEVVLRLESYRREHEHEQDSSTATVNLTTAISSSKKLPKKSVGGWYTNYTTASLL